MQFYDFSFKTLQGQDYSLASARDKVCLIVNIARKCGYTPQMNELQKIHEDYRDRGLVVLGFPSNSFLFQEPGDSEEILCAYEADYRIDFPMMEKSSMLPVGMNPLFEWLSSVQPNTEAHGLIKWNFTKFLIDKQGQVRFRFGPATTPLQMIPQIETLLNE